MIPALLNDRYRLEEELGKGGMGVIFRAHDQLLERDVAIKLLSMSSMGVEGQKRLLAEAQATAKLNHPNIVSVYDAGEVTLPGLEKKIAYIVMELIHGDSLYDRLPEICGQWKQVLSIGVQISSALEHAHQENIIHRDLKPENVILTPNGVIKLTDFGLAQSLSTRWTQGEEIAGTVFYLAPEVAMQHGSSSLSDLYSLGVMLYELSTGQLPFQGEDPLEVISQHLYATVVPPRALAPTIPSALDLLIQQLMSKEPSERPANAAEVRQVLEVLNNLARLESTLLEPGKEVPMLDRMARGKLIGRERELSEMSAAWREALTGEGRTLLVSGEPGIGKTRLMQEFVTRVSVSGAHVMKGECYAEGGMPYAPFTRMILDSLAQENERATGPAHRKQATLPVHVLAGLAAIAPELRLRYPSIPETPHTDPQSEQQYLFESITAWLTNLAGGLPLLLFLEDVHWADSGTLALVRFLSRRLRQLPLVTALTYRETELEEASPLMGMLQDLTRDRMAVRIKLGRLDRDDTRKMLASLLHPIGQIEDSLVEAIYRETEGNPFFIEEVTRSLIEEGKLCFEDVCWVARDGDDIQIPQSVRLAIQARLARLPEETQEVLRLASVFGREFEFALLMHTAGLEEDNLIAALENAEKAQTIAEIPRGKGRPLSFSFMHALIPTTLQDGMSGLRRQRLHRKAAAALEVVYPDNPSFYDELAHHYEQAGDPERALKYSLCAAEYALEVYASQEAERYYRFALEVCDGCEDQPEILSGMGEAMFRQSHYADAIEAWYEAIRLFRKTGRVDQAAQLFARCSRAAWYTGDPPRGLEIAKEGMQAIRQMTGVEDLGTLPPDQLSRGIVSLIHETARAHRFNGQPEPALILCRQALEIAGRQGYVEIMADALATYGILPGLTSEEIVAALLNSVELAENANLPAIAIRGHTNLAEHYRSMGALHKSRQHYAKGREQASRMGMKDWEADQFCMYIDVSIDLCDVSGAQTSLNELDDIISRLPTPTYFRMFSDILKGSLLHKLGECDKAIRTFREVRQEALRDEMFMNLVSETLLREAEVKIDLELLDEAEADLYEALDICGGIPTSGMIVAQMMLAQVMAQQGKLEPARKMVTELRPQPFIQGNPLVEKRIVWIEAWILYHEGRWPEAEAAFRVVIAFVGEVGMRSTQARLLEKLGELHPEPEQASEASRQALEIYRGIPSPGHAARVEAKLKTI